MTENVRRFDCEGLRSVTDEDFRRSKCPTFSTFQSVPHCYVIAQELPTPLLFILIIIIVLIVQMRIYIRYIYILEYIIIILIVQMRIYIRYIYILEYIIIILIVLMRMNILLSNRE